MSRQSFALAHANLGDFSSNRFEDILKQSAGEEPPGKT